MGRRGRRRFKWPAGAINTFSRIPARRRPSSHAPLAARARQLQAAQAAPATLCPRRAFGTRDELIILPPSLLPPPPLPLAPAGPQPFVAGGAERRRAAPSLVIIIALERRPSQRGRLMGAPIYQRRQMPAGSRKNRARHDRARLVGKLAALAKLFSNAHPNTRPLERGRLCASRRFGGSGEPAGRPMVSNGRDTGARAGHKASGPPLIVHLARRPTG